MHVYCCISAAPRRDKAGSCRDSVGLLEDFAPRPQNIRPGRISAPFLFSHYRKTAPAAGRDELVRLPGPRRPNGGATYSQLDSFGRAHRSAAVARVFDDTSGISIRVWLPATAGIRGKTIATLAELVRFVSYLFLASPCDSRVSRRRSRPIFDTLVDASNRSQL